MTKVVQLSGDSAENLKSYPGPARELVVDITNWDLLLQDGTNPGGKRILNRDNADERYQPRSLELDGLTGFSPEQRGYPVRRGPSEYVIRGFEVDAENLTIANADAYKGNTKFALNPTITSDHDFQGDVIASGSLTVSGVTVFTSVPEFKAGAIVTPGEFLTGDVIGDLTGNVLGDTTGTHTGPTIGDVDVSEGVLILADDQIPTTAIDGLLDFVKLNGIPAGVVSLWSGTAANIPAGWFLCNGLNGTPDLRNKFVRGAGVGGGFDDPGVIAGADVVTPTATMDSVGDHTHTLAGDVGSNTTGVSLTKVFKNVDAADQTGCMENVTMADPGHDHPQGGTAESNGAHIHTITCDEHSTIPEYYALCYIMKG